MKLEIRFEGKIELDKISPFDYSISDSDMYRLFDMYVDKCGFDLVSSEFNFTAENYEERNIICEW